jgi:hypothetical protein
MAAKKVDGVVEAVRYAPDGNVALVRLYERRGPAFSDRIVLDREAFAAALRGKKRFVAGKRLPLMGATFETGAEIRLVKTSAGEFIQSELGSGDRDDLKGVPQI